MGVGKMGGNLKIPLLQRQDTETRCTRVRSFIYTVETCDVMAQTKLCSLNRFAMLTRKPRTRKIAMAVFHGYISWSQTALNNKNFILSFYLWVYHSTYITGMNNSLMCVVEGQL